MLQHLANPHQMAQDKQNYNDMDLQEASTDTGFLPNFCKGEMVLNVVILAEFLAIVLTIVTPAITTSIFQDLFLISLFLQWIAVMSVSALCLAGPSLNKLPEKRALLVAYAMLLCITWLVGELSIWLLASFNYIASARPQWHLYFHAQNLLVSGIINALALRYFVARHQLRQKTLATERVRSQLLRLRIRPHFLFSSMNIIASLTQRAPARAEAAIEDMADLFRLMLDDSKDLMPVQSEMQIARKYLKLEKLRLDKRLNANWSVHGITRQAKTPVLILQLLLENAIHHGIEQLPEGGDIDIKLLIEDDNQLLISVGNPTPENEENDQERDAILDNIRLRLKDQYGDDAHLTIQRDSHYFSVEVKHPAFGGVLNENPGR